VHVRALYKEDGRTIPTLKKMKLKYRDLRSFYKNITEAEM